MVDDEQARHAASVVVVPHLGGATLCAMSASLRHRLVVASLSRLRTSPVLVSEDGERQRLELRNATLDRSLRTRLVRGFEKRFTVTTEQVPGASGEFPAFVVTPVGVEAQRTVLYLHGGGFISPADALQLRYACRLAQSLRARVVLPDYPLAPAHTWRDSLPGIVEQASRWAAASPDGLVLAGDSAGGGYALAVAQGLRARGGPQPTHLLMVSPWVDLTTSTPDTAVIAASAPSHTANCRRMLVYAGFWAGSPDELGRAESSPGLADLSGLPPALMFCGTSDVLVPGCRLLVERAKAAGWDLTYVEADGATHVYPLLPLVPEARVAWRRTRAFLAP